MEICFRYLCTKTREGNTGTRADRDVRSLGAPGYTYQPTKLALLFFPFQTALSPWRLLIQLFQANEVRHAKREGMPAPIFLPCPPNREKNGEGGDWAYPPS
jgi:hypothetical protein